MHYRHIKRVCRGEAPLKIEWIINDDTESGMAGIRLKDYIYNIVYVPYRFGRRYRQYHGITEDQINIEQENPIYWFYVRESEIKYMIGVRLDDLMRVLLESEIKHHRIWGANVADIFRIYIRHLKWRLKHEGIKFTNQHFSGIRDIDSYSLVHRPQVVYSTMARIFTNYTKQKAKWQMK